MNESFKSNNNKIGIGVCIRDEMMDLYKPKLNGSRQNVLFMLMKRLNYLL